ncbi:MAG TPA: antitoxin Xre/MbcA/ParS toxin-binding domain-containing protein [Candidatus Binataceae bacterium]|nr:antitoxin Xre/MbcA/ParS toxin-binding domain-containing protein [Candidatus Binataceae bacterium]
MISADIATILGGEKVLGRGIRTELEVEGCIRRGLPVGVLDAILERSVLEAAEIYQWIIPRRTLAHRIKKKQRLSIEESDRVSRLARIYALAVETFGNEEKARHWLRRPLRPLGGRTAMEMMETELGGHQVETLLGRIAHGIAA